MSAVRNVTPTPRGGGVGIVTAVVGFWLVALWLCPSQIDVQLKVALGFASASSLIAVIGWVDNRDSLSTPLRLLLYLLISGGFTAIVGVFRSLDIPLLGEIQLVGLALVGGTLLWLVGFLNIFNFMDGIDGLAGSQALIASLFLATCVLPRRTS